MKFGDLRGILQYVPQFRGRTFVVAIDGAVIASENFANVLLDLAVLHSLNVKLAVVHGAGLQISQLAEERGLGGGTYDGCGPTDGPALDVSIDAVSRLTNKLMQDLSAVGLRAATANAVRANPAGILDGEDMGFTGRIDRVDGQGLSSFIDEGMLPVIPPIGFDGKGGTLRVNSDAVAIAVAEALGASKILFLTSAGATTIADRQLSVAEARTMSEAPEQTTSRLASMLGFASQACSDGIDRVHILDGDHDESLLAELFSNEGVGTMVYRDDYRQIRGASASDVAEVVSLIRGAVHNKELVQRRRSDILENIGDYHVLELDGNIVGTVAVHVMGDDAELACLFIKRNHEASGHGKRLASYAELVAGERGAQRLFALSTQASGFFKKLGYRECGEGDLPESRARALAESGRNSRVFCKDV